jgi:hypothetical protein
VARLQFYALYAVCVAPPEDEQVCSKQIEALVSQSIELKVHHVGIIILIFIAMFAIIRTCLYPESAEWNTRRPILFKLHVNIILSSKSRFSKWFFTSGFLDIYHWGSIRAKYSILLILNELINPDNIW